MYLLLRDLKLQFLARYLWQLHQLVVLAVLLRNQGSLGVEFYRFVDRGEREVIQHDQVFVWEAGQALVREWGRFLSV